MPARPEALTYHSYCDALLGSEGAEELGHSAHQENMELLESKVTFRFLHVFTAGGLVVHASTNARKGSH